MIDLSLCHNIYQSDRDTTKKENIQTIDDGMIEARDREKWRKIIQDPRCKA